MPGKPGARRPVGARRETSAIDALLGAARHPHEDAIHALRGLVLAADPSISEGVKWNSVSFRTTEWFATVHLRTTSGVAVVMHLGAKVRALGRDGLAIADPSALLKWLAADRAMVTFANAADVGAKREAFTAVVRQWIAHV
jgi:hypothetical protein